APLLEPAGDRVALAYGLLEQPADLVFARPSARGGVEDRPQPSLDAREHLARAGEAPAQVVQGLVVPASEELVAGAGEVGDVDVDVPLPPDPVEPPDPLLEHL